MKIFTYVLFGLVGLTTFTITTDAEAYWHGYRGGYRGPGWGGGCWRCGPGWAGPAAVNAGVEVVEVSTAPPVIVEQAPPTVYVQQPAPVVVAPGPVAPVGYSIPPIGSTFPNLLPGCFLAPRNGINFYQCQGFRMRPLYGGNAFYYRVVPG